MADKGLIESARRMYGAKDAARQEAKKDMLRSGEMLYRGLRDFGAMQQREKMYKESMAFREKSLQQSMEFRQEQMDWQKLKYDEMQQQREYDRIAQNSAQLQYNLGKVTEDPAVLVGPSLNFYKDEISKLSDMIAKREGDPKQLTEQRQKLLNELSTASGQYTTFLDGARQIIGMNLSDPNAVPDFDMMSNDPKSLKAKKMWTTVINGMQDGTAKFNFDGGDFTITANFDGKGPSTVKLNESGMLDYNLKNSGKGNELFGIYGNSVNAAITGTQANAQLLATNYAASLSYNDVVSLSRDYDPNWNGTDTSTFKYNRFIGENGKRVEMINNTWMDAQNMWWNEIRNTTGVSGNEQEWKDNEGNTYKRSGEGADMRWTKTDVNGNMSEHEWWNDKGWSGDNGTGVKLRDAFSNWLGDISADYINKTHYKPKPPIGSRFKPPADLGSTFAQVQDIIDNGQLNRLKGIKFGDQRINQIEQQEDGTFNLLFSSVMGGDYESGAIVNIDLTKKGTAKETLFNYIGDVDSGNVYTSPRYAEYNLSVDNKVVETGKDTEGITTTSGVNVRKGGAAEVMVGQNLEKMKIANEQLNQIDVVVDKAISDYADNKNWKSIYSTINNYIIGQKGNVSAGEDLLNQWSIPAEVSAEEKQSIENEVDAQIQTGFSDLDFGSMGTLDRDKVRKILTYVEYRIRNKK